MRSKSKGINYYRSECKTSLKGYSKKKKTVNHDRF